MRLTDIVTESMNDSEENIKEKLENQCQPWLSTVGWQPPVYHGSRHHSKPFLKFKSENQLDSFDPEEHSYVFKDAMDALGVRANRKNSIFVTGDPGQAGIYTTNPHDASDTSEGDVYTIWPIGDFEYVWSPEVFDLFMDIEDIEDEIDQEDDRNLEEWIKENYKANKGIKEALEKGVEIMLYAPKGYYAVRKDIYEKFLEDPEKIPTKQKIERNPEEIFNIENPSSELIEFALKRKPEIAFTHNMDKQWQEYAVKIRPELLEHIKPSEQLVWSAIEKNPGLLVHYDIPRTVFTSEQQKYLVQKYPVNVKFFPEYATEETLKRAIEISSNSGKITRFLTDYQKNGGTLSNDLIMKAAIWGGMRNNVVEEMGDGLSEKQLAQIVQAWPHMIYQIDKPSTELLKLAMKLGRNFNIVPQQLLQKYPDNELERWAQANGYT